MQTGGFLGDRQRLRRLAAQGATPENKLLEPYAVVTSKRGIVADARHVPLADGTASLIVSKDFPWFHRVSLMDRTVLGHPWYGRILSMVEGYLEEQHRLLAPGGKSVVLADGEDPFRTMWHHIKLAERLGFSVELVRDRSKPISGLVLTKQR
jgi:SAM-dependent methyltransferase